MGLSQMQSQQDDWLSTLYVLYIVLLKKTVHLHTQDEKFGETAGELSA